MKLSIVITCCNEGIQFGFEPEITAKAAKLDGSTKSASVTTAAPAGKA